MIVGCGTDIVRVCRFDSWEKFTSTQLARVFTPAEIVLIKEHGEWSSERAAAYFALKEAFYKAMSNALVKKSLLKNSISFIRACSFVEVYKDEWGIPQLVVDWEKINAVVATSFTWDISISLAHEAEYAVAFVILSD